MLLNSVGLDSDGQETQYRIDISQSNHFTDTMTIVLCVKRSDMERIMGVSPILLLNKLKLIKELLKTSSPNTSLPSPPTSDGMGGSASNSKPPANSPPSRDDDETFRQAVAYDPQGSLGDILNRGMLNVFRANDCQLLMQIHDAILVQYPERQEDEIIPKIQSQLRQHIELRHGRELIMPFDVKTGWNWGNYDAKSNEAGLKSYAPGKDKRRRPETVHILDR
jgi:hypothetical protein